MNGPGKKYDPEQLFDLFYNGGQRRTFVELERVCQDQHGIEVSNATIRRYAEEFDWNGRAAGIDEETRKIRDKRLANMIATQRVRHIEAVATLATKFMRRLVPSTPGNPNPAEILPGDIELQDMIALVKEFDRLVGATDKGLEEEERSVLDDMERAIQAMDARETPALSAGEGGS